MSEAHETLSDSIRWALDAAMDPAMAAADWLAREINPDHSSAVSLLADPNTTLAQLSAAKDAYKTMRIVGETAADRRLGARLYAASIAGGLVHHDRRISRQSDAAIRRAIQHLIDDRTVAEPLRTLAGSAMCVLNQRPSSA